MTIKVRANPGQVLRSSNYVFGNVSQELSTTIYNEVQKIETFSHSNWQRQLSEGRDVGGSFDSKKVTIHRAGFPWFSRANYNPTIGKWSYETNTWLCGGPSVAEYTSSKINATSNSAITAAIDQAVPFGDNVATLIGMGTKAIDIVRPTNPAVDMATTLAELYSERKFFSVPGKGGGAPGEYLNYQFGIAPTVDVVRDFRNTMDNRDAIIRQYQRDSGKLIRRRYHFNPEVTTQKTVASTPCRTVGVGLNTYQNPGGTLTTTTTTTKNYWFSGAFRYSIPKDAFPKKISELNHLYGVVPGVSTAWELLPFSWLVDYFTPIGGILSSMDAFLRDGLVIPYGYLMLTTTVEVEEVWKGPITNSDGLLQGIEVATLLKKTRLQRIPASPFGFGLLSSNLSKQQLSILAALGLSMRK